MQIQPILGYFGAILGLYQPPAPPFWISAPLFTYPGSAPENSFEEIQNLLIHPVSFFALESQADFHLYM